MSDNKVTLDQLDNSAVEAMSSSVGDVSMLNTENKTIVGALAEIVGKKEIANAIGEPLAETDKFTEMSSEINGLLSTFKTNMMNAGVVVESGDKFKALIDKIKGLTEGEGNKGVRFVSGHTTDVVFKTHTHTYTNSEGEEVTDSNKMFDIEIELDFDPSIILVASKFTLSTLGLPTDMESITVYDKLEKNKIAFGEYGSKNSSNFSNSYILPPLVEENKYYLPIAFPALATIQLSNITLNQCTWYAIGVGEEDTTLRDSLASILEEEGVNVTEEDDMASLISKVDNEFKDNDNEITAMKRELVDALIAKGVDDISYDTDWSILISLISKFKDFINIKFDGTQFLCGGNHTFLLKNDGTVWATGNNGYGQLGLGYTNNSTRFQQVNITDVKQIACGFNFTAILKNDGSVWTCGYNGYGQLGLGNTTNQSTFTKVTTNINNDVTQIYAGGYHLFALKNDGTVWCCGKNDYGQLGLGTTTKKTTFTQVTTNTEDTVKISCGYEHTYILKNNGMIFSCGKNSNGQLGLSTTNDMTTFNQVQNMDNVRNIISGGYHVFVVKKDGTLWACGYNGSGQLGLNDTESRATFVQVNVNVDDIQHVICGFNHSLIIRNDGILYAAGENGNGELGMNNTTDMRTFTNVPNLSSGIIAAYAGEFFTMIIDNEGIVYATGKNDSGQLGLSESTTRKSFTVINQIV